MLCDLQPLPVSPWPAEGVAPSEGRDRSESAGCEAQAALRITPRDALRRRVYLAPLGVSLVVEGAAIREATLWPATLGVDLILQPHARAPTSEATLFVDVERVEPPPPLPAFGYAVACEASSSCRVRRADIAGGAAQDARASREYVITLARGDGITSLTLRPQQ